MMAAAAQSVTRHAAMWSGHTCDGQATLHVLFRQLEEEFLCVVVYNLGFVKKQRQEALLAAGESCFCGCARPSRYRLLILGWGRAVAAAAS